MKTLRLFKRDHQGREMDPATPGYKDRPYYVRFQIGKRMYPVCTGTPDAKLARDIAQRRYREYKARHLLGQSARLDAPAPPQFGTLAELFAAYRTGPSEANADTREMNIAALQQVYSSTGRAELPLRISDLTPQLLRASFETVQAKVLAEPDQEAAASLKRSANSRWAKARSLFTPRCLAHYQDKGLIPDAKLCSDFVTAGDNAEFTRIPKILYHPPDDKIIQQTLTAWENLGEADRDLFLVIGHELAFGLRISEMAQAQWGWHTLRNGYPALDGRAAVKNKTGIIRVRALDPWFTILNRRIETFHWRGEPEELILPGTAAYRTDAIFRVVSEFLRTHGWETRKTNHALRAYAGSQIAMKYDIYDAQKWLRHSTVKVTEQHYSHFVDDFKPADLDTIPARWAAVHQEFVPQIVASHA